MIRVLLYLVIVALLAFGAVWLAERPGDVVITWQGGRVETSVMVLMVAAAAVAVAAVMLWSIARAIWARPMRSRASGAIAAACAPIRRCRRG